MRKRGFTLLEIMIIVVIIGIIASLAVPGFVKLRRVSQSRAIANNLRVFSDAFETYNLETGEWPDSHSSEGSIPSEMEGWINEDMWVNGSPIKGHHAFEDPGAGDSVYISLVADEIDESLQKQVDELLDDGNLSAGRVRGDSQSIDYYLEADLLP